MMTFDEDQIERAAKAIVIGIECETAFEQVCQAAGIDPNTVTGSPLLSVALAQMQLDGMKS